MVSGPAAHIRRFLPMRRLSCRRLLRRRSRNPGPLPADANIVTASPTISRRRWWRRCRIRSSTRSSISSTARWSTFTGRKNAVSPAGGNGVGQGFPLRVPAGGNPMPESLHPACSKPPVSSVSSHSGRRWSPPESSPPRRGNSAGWSNRSEVTAPRSGTPL